jgi:hypothetical protein
MKKSETTVSLPQDGKLIYVTEWRKQLTWLVFGWFALLDIGIAITVFIKGSLIGVLIGLAVLVLAFFTLRLAVTGLMVETDGVTLRAALWTYHWGWDEVDHFELKERGYIRLRIHLRDGRIKKAPGFFARKPTEEQRCQALFAALEDRREREQDRAVRDEVLPKTGSDGE